MRLVGEHGIWSIIFFCGVVVGIFRCGRICIVFPGVAVYAAGCPRVAERQIEGACNVTNDLRHGFKTSAGAAGKVLVAVPVNPVVFSDTVGRNKHNMTVDVSAFSHKGVQPLNNEGKLSAQSVLSGVHIPTHTVFHMPFVVRAQQDNEIGTAHFVNCQRLEIAVAAGVWVILHILIFRRAQPHYHIDKSDAAVGVGGNLCSGQTCKLRLPASVCGYTVPDNEDFFIFPFAFHICYYTPFRLFTYILAQPRAQCNAARLFSPKKRKMMKC